MYVELARPAALALLLAVVPLLVYLHLTSRTYLPPGRRRLALGLRLAVAGLLVLALAGPKLGGAADRLAVAFLMDLSDSVGPDARAWELDWVRRALRSMPAGDEAAIVVFGADSLVERPPGPDQDLPPVSSVVDGRHTDLARAIRLGMATLPGGRARKLVLLSDGNENSGDGLEQARLAAAADVPVYTVPLPASSRPEVLLDQVETPSHVRQGETFTSRLVVRSTVDTPARLHLLVDGKLVSAQNLDIAAGTSSISVSHDPLPEGFHVFHWQLEPEVDGFAENNEGGSFTVVTGRARVLLVEASPGEAHYLAEALRAAGLIVETRPTPNVPTDLAALRNFDSVVLVNVPADKLSQGQMVAIKTFVQDLGGGLVVIGGEQSFTIGGYGRTPLEEALPIRMELRGRRLSSSTALVLVIDTSGSMGGGLSGTAKIDMAKEAAIRAMEMLGPSDQLGIVAFEDTPRWVVETQYVTNPRDAEAQIASMAPGGGTSIYPALETAYENLASVEAKVKHIILLTDGLSPPGDWEGLTARMRAANITLSTIAIGTDADMNLLQYLASLGRGRYYEGNDPFEIPQFVVKETREVARAAIVEEEFRPIMVGASPILEGIDVSSMPTLKGYVSTTPKPTSQVIMVSRDIDPVLSEWQFGLGRVVAWTSDVKNRWSVDWLTWPDFSRFWAQLVKRTIPSPADRSFQISVAQEGSLIRLTVDAVSQDQQYMNFIPTRASVATPAGRQLNLDLPQVAPGRYEVRFPADGEGAYLLEVAQGQGEGPNGAGGPGGVNGRAGAAEDVLQPSGFVIPYSAEYRDLRPGTAFLARLAERGGGKVLTDPSQAFLHDRPGQGAPEELMAPLLAIAALLFMLDVASRRLRVSFQEVERLLGQVRQLARAEAATATRLRRARLLDAKARARQGEEGTGRWDEMAGRPRGEEGGHVGSAGQDQHEGKSRPDLARPQDRGARLLEAKKRARSSEGGKQ